jgi:hypothetical protein
LPEAHVDPTIIYCGSVQNNPQLSQAFFEHSPLWQTRKADLRTGKEEEDAADFFPHSTSKFDCGWAA